MDLNRLPELHTRPLLTTRSTNARGTAWRNQGSYSMLRDGCIVGIVRTTAKRLFYPQWDETADRSEIYIWPRDLGTPQRLFSTTESTLGDLI